MYDWGVVGSENSLFKAVDALVERRGVLPPPRERERLRKAHGLTQEDVAAALEVRRATIVSWEAGRTEPRPPQREAYARLLEKLAALYPAPEPPPPRVSASEPGGRGSAPQALADTDTDPDAGNEDQEQPRPAPPPAAAAASTRTRSTPSMSHRPGRPGAAKASAAPARATRTAPTPAVAAVAGAPDSAFPAGPLAVLDGAGAAYLVDGRTLECPAATISELVDWALAAGIGQSRLHRAGRDADPLVVLTADAAERLGLPLRLADRRGLRLPEDHEVVRDLTAAGWQLTRRGFGPWARVYRPVEAGGRRQCVQFAVVPWDALDARAWPGVDQLPGAELARVLGTYAHRVLTPRGSTAVNGLELMTTLRPPTRAVGDDAGGWTSGPVPGSLTHAVDPAPPEAPDEHPVAAGRGEGQVLDEEAYEWVRDPELLTDAECALPWAVGLDVNMAFAAAANRLTVGLGEPLHTDGPRFDKKLPGCWYVDLSDVDVDPRLPSPFSPAGARPTGPAWYATPTVAYTAELGADVRPLEAWIRPEAGAYLDSWYERLRDAYLATMADLGVTKDLTEQQFLEAMAGHNTPTPAWPRCCPRSRPRSRAASASSANAPRE